MENDEVQLLNSDEMNSNSNSEMIEDSNDRNDLNDEDSLQQLDPDSEQSNPPLQMFEDEEEEVTKQSNQMDFQQSEDESNLQADEEESNQLLDEESNQQLDEEESNQRLEQEEESNQRLEQEEESNQLLDEESNQQLDEESNQQLDEESNQQLDQDSEMADLNEEDQQSNDRLSTPRSTTNHHQPEQSTNEDEKSIRTIDSEFSSATSMDNKGDRQNCEAGGEDLKENEKDLKESSDVKEQSSKSALNCDQDIEEGSGFPRCFDGWVIRGKTIPINKKTRNDIEIDGNDAILDCVSQVVPILLKKPNIFPPKYVNEHLKKKDDQKSASIKDETKKQESGDEAAQADSEKKETNVDAKVIDTDKKKPHDDSKSMLMISDYYNSSVGNFLMGIGLSKCKEAVYKDGMRQAQKLIRKEGERAEYVDELNKQTQLYHEAKGANSIFTFDQLRCANCDFKTESEAVMEGHYLMPHISNKREYKCNFCAFVTRDARVIQYHFNAEHKKYYNHQMPPHLYECPTCEYESNQKSKAATHIAKCVKQFEENLEEQARIQYTKDSESEYPAITPRPIGQDDLKLYESTMQALRPVILNPRMQMPNVPGLPRALQQQMLILLQQQYNQQQMKLGKAMQTKLTNQHNNALKQLQQQQTNSLMSNLLMNNTLNPNALASLNMNSSALLNNLNSLANLNNLSSLNSNLNNLNSFAKASPHLYNMLQSGSQLLNKNLSSNSTLSSSQLKNRQPAANQLLVQQLQKPNMKGLLQNNNAKPSSSKDMNSLLVAGTSSSDNNKTGTFVICEICDGYIKDLEQLRTHMSWIHKVKIHPKMIASRPPLNCQKCQWRFFTDQGLERHLLGAHGLVTSNMQDLVDQEQDSGRCTICGKVLANKLVLHMNQSHKITLRPAHLSYKCTVCSATFNLYRLFESHVYMVHSNCKRANNNSEGNPIAKKAKTMNGI